MPMTQPLFIASDGIPFWLQNDGTLTDTFNSDNADIVWDNVQEVFDAISNGILEVMTKYDASYASYLNRVMAIQEEIELEHKYVYDYPAIKNGESD
tara:strand:- start:398 stop:685 length:288 start_codon:yes stop_codon:yes gene_type:complete